MGKFFLSAQESSAPCGPTRASGPTTSPDLASLGHPPQRGGSFTFPSIALRRRGSAFFVPLPFPRGIAAAAYASSAQAAYRLLSPLAKAHSLRCASSPTKDTPLVGSKRHRHIFLTLRGGTAQAVTDEVRRREQAPALRVFRECVCRGGTPGPPVKPSQSALRRTALPEGEPRVDEYIDPYTQGTA